MFLKGPSQYRPQRTRGSLLIVALWMIAILAILSVSIGQHVRQKISLADRIERRISSTPWLDMRGSRTGLGPCSGRSWGV
jgi:hypothetical protein